MAKRRGSRRGGNEPGTADRIGGPDDRARAARWEDVPDRVRVGVDAALAAYRPAPLNPDGSVAQDRLAADDDRGRLHLDRSGIDDAALAPLVREKVARLTALTEFRLGNNRIGDAAALARLIEAIRVGGNPGGNLTEVVVDDNPLAFTAADGGVRRVPPEALAERDPGRLLAQLLRYAPTPGDAAQFRALHCLRATILGRQEVGKSHLASRLVNGDKLPTDGKGNTIIPAKTADWELHTLSLENVVLPSAADRQSRPVTVEVRLLDFGGDPELHSAHRLLLRDKRNFYIVVCNASTDRDASLMDYWLRVVRAYGSRGEVVGDAEREPPREIERAASAAVVLSWYDKPVHASFSGADDAALGREHRVNVHLVTGYWEPTATIPRSPPLAGEFADAIGRVRKAIHACAVEQAHELGVHYPTAFFGVVDAFDPAKQRAAGRRTPLCDGPIPLADVEAMFASATGNALDGRTGADLLCNLGLAVCPKLDADGAGQDWERARLPAASADTVALTGKLMFGSDWLKKLIYKVVRRTGSPLADERGVVEDRDLMRMLEQAIGGPAAADLAECVRALLTVNRMILPRDKSRRAYVVPERLPEADAEAVRSQGELFANACRWALKPKLLLASHLPQFLAEEYVRLAATDGLHSAVFKDMGKLSWREDAALEALLTANLNQGAIEIAVRGGRDVEKARRFAQLIADSWDRVFGERGTVLEPVPAKGAEEANRPRGGDSGGPAAEASVEERAVPATGASAARPSYVRPLRSSGPDGPRAPQDGPTQSPVPTPQAARRRCRIAVEMSSKTILLDGRVRKTGSGQLCHMLQILIAHDGRPVETELLLSPSSKRPAFDPGKRVSAALPSLPPDLRKLVIGQRGEGGYLLSEDAFLDG